MISGLSNINITPSSVFLITEPLKCATIVTFVLLSIIFSHFFCTIVYSHFKESRVRYTNKRGIKTMEKGRITRIEKGKITRMEKGVIIKGLRGGVYI